MSDDKVIFDAAEHTAASVTVNAEWLAGYEQAMAVARGSAVSLVAKSKNLVALLDEEEKYHGGLVRVETLKAKNELRLELAKWK